MTIRLYLLAPETIFAARVAQASFTYPLAEVTYDTVTTGAYGDIAPGMTVLFGTSAGADDLGRQRVRKAATADTLYFGRSSIGTRDGEVALADNAYITVLDDYRVWSKIPYITSEGVIYKDHDIAVGTYTTAPPPVAHAGTGTAATIDSVTSLITVQFTAAQSFSTAGGSISTYAWDVGDGSITVGTAASETITATFPAGFRWVALTVTDDNGKTHTTRVPVFARDPASDDTIGTFSIDSHTITQEGQRLRITVREDIDEGTYPDGTLVMLWENEPSGASDRSHMLFVGWHQTDPATIAAERTGLLRDVSLECVDVAGRLDTLPGFEQSVEVAASPAAWTQMTSPNMDKYLHYLLHWHSTALEVAPWTWTGTGATYPFVVLGNPGQSLFDQVARRAKALVPDYHFGCNTLGELQTVVDPMLQDTGDRTATVQATLSEAYWSEIRYAHTRPPRYHWHWGSAIVASGSDISAVFCVAPGSSPGQGESTQEPGEQLAVSQTTLNACEGHRYARANAQEGYFNVRLAQGDDLGIEPSDMTWVRLTISADNAAQRGLTFTEERGLVREVRIAYDARPGGLVKTVDLLWERETDGYPATTYVPPTDGLPDQEFTFSYDWYDPLPEDTTRTTNAEGAEGWMAALMTMYQYAAVDGKYCTNPTAESPSWSNLDVGRNVAIMWKDDDTFDTYACLRNSGAGGVIYRCAFDDMPLPGSWSEMQDADAFADELGYLGDYTNVNLFAMAFSTLLEGRGWVGGICKHDYDEMSVFVATTLDGWETIERVYECENLDSSVNAVEMLGEVNDLAIDEHNDTIYLLYTKRSNGGTYDDPAFWRLWRSQDLGVSFSKIQEDSFNQGEDGRYSVWYLADQICNLYVPYSTAGVVYWSTTFENAESGIPADPAPCIYYSGNYGTTRQDISSGLDYGITGIRGPWSTSGTIYCVSCQYLTNQLVRIMKYNGSWSVDTELTGEYADHTGATFYMEFLNNAEPCLRIVGPGSDLFRIDDGSPIDMNFSGYCRRLIAIPGAS